MKIRGFNNPIFSALDFDNYPPSVSNLPIPLTINGQTVYPTFRYNGKDAGASTWAPWGYGETLTLQAGTAPTLNAGSPLLGYFDDSVKFNNGGYYKFATAAAVSVTTEDIVIEMVFSAGNVAQNNTIFDSTSNLVTRGIFLWQAGSNLNLRIATAAAYSTLTTNIGPFTNTDSWYHILGFINRDENSVNGGQWYFNGKLLTGGTNMIGAVASIANTNVGAIGAATGDGSFSNGGKLAFLSLYKAANWHQASIAGPVEWATIAATRFAQLTGLYPQYAKSGVYTPTYSRTTAGYLDKIEKDGSTKLYLMGPNWPRVCVRRDNAEVERRGVLVETAVMNMAAYSDNIVPATWTGGARWSSPGTAVVCPDGVSRTTCTIHEDASLATTHYPAIVNASYTSTNGVRYVTSGYIKPINRTWVRPQTYFAPYHGCSFNFVGAGFVGTMQGQTDRAGIKAIGYGWYFWWFSFVENTAPRGAVGLILMSADGVVSFDGLNQDSIHAWGIQFEVGSYPTSYVAAPTGAVTKTADALRYSENLATNYCQYSELLTSWTGGYAAASPISGPVGTTFRLTFTTSVQEQYNAALNTGAALSNRTFTIGCWLKRISGGTAIYLASTDQASWPPSWQTQVTVPDIWTYVITSGTFTTDTNTSINMVIGTAQHKGGPNLDPITFDICAPMLVEGTTLPIVYIPTTTTAVTGLSNPNLTNIPIGQGNLECSILVPNIDQAGSPFYWQISDNTDNNRIFMNANSVGDDVPSFNIVNTTSQTLITGVSDLWDGYQHSIRGEWSNNNAKLYVDKNIEGTPDITVTVPLGLSQLDVGGYKTAGNELNGLISKIKISK